jgi:O-antigen/teichoic acid export membrane protein
MVSLLQICAILILRESNLVLLASFLVSVQVLATLLAGILCSFVIPQFWHSWNFSSFLLSSTFLKATAPIALLAVLTILYQRLNVTMLSLMTSPNDTGIFSAAARVVEASKTAHIAVFAALYPAMANVVSLREQRSNLIAITYLKYLGIGAILISFSLFAFATPLVKLLYGNEFILSTNVLQILAWTLIPFTLNTYLTLSFLASKQEQLVGRALTASLLGLLILNLWWIPGRGPEGAAWALLASECLQSVVLLVSARSSARLPVQGEAHEFPQLS